MSSGLDGQTRILTPAIDFSSNGYLVQTINNFATLAELSPEVFGKLEERLADLQKRTEALKAREQKVAETIQNFQGAKSAIRIETPTLFPFSINFDGGRIAVPTLRADTKIVKNERSQKFLASNCVENNVLHDSKVKGPKNSVDNKALGECIKFVCQSNRVPTIYPINTQAQNSYLEKLNLPRSTNYKRKMKFIDSAHIFNTNNSVFYHYVPDRLAEKKQKNNTQHANPILESGNLTNFSVVFDRAEENLETSYQPKATKQISLLDAPIDNLFGEKLVDDAFFGAGPTIDDDGDDFFSNLNKKQVAQSQNATQNAPSTSNSNPQPGQPISQQPQPIGQSSPGANQPPVQTSGQNAQQIPNPMIPAPPPLPGSQLDNEGGNIADETKELKPIAEEKSRIE